MGGGLECLITPHCGFEQNQSLIVFLTALLDFKIVAGSKGETWGCTFSLSLQIA